jgi:hypothetical protein
VVALVCLFLAACSSDGHDSIAIQRSLEEISVDPKLFYATQSPATDPDPYVRLFEGVPADVAEIVRAVQGALVRIDLVEREGRPGDRRRIDTEVQIPTVRRMLERITELDNRPLTAARRPHDRLICVCAQYALLTTSLLRYHGIPARARGGFETYFSDTRHHDHWITEYWDDEAGRWVRVDAEIDGAAHDRWGKKLDGMDLPYGTFLSGAEAWLLCRREGRSPDQFGIWGGEWMGGWDFVLNELLLDFNALNKVESLPWDPTRLGQRGHASLNETELELLDRTAEAVVAGDDGFERVRALFRAHPELRKSG